MSQIDMKKAAGFLLAGAVVGAGVALLYAPQSGSQTKEDIRKLARKTANRIDDLQADIRLQVADWVDDMTEAIKDGVDRGKKLGAEGYAQVLQSFDSAKQCVDEGKARVEQMINKETA
jgi:gas vesicle protein